MLKRPFVLFSILLYFSWLGQSHAQVEITSEQKANIKALNNYVSFLNTSIHGMMVVNKLLFDYNQQLNRYLDVESVKINNYSNKDLPQNIFEDSGFCYEVSPYEFYYRAKTASRVLDPSDASTLNGHLDRLKTILEAINKIRFDLEARTLNVDLADEQNARKVYEKLEEAGKYYQDFYVNQIALEKDLQRIYPKYAIKNLGNFAPLVSVMDRGYKSARSALEKIRNKDIGSYETALKTLAADKKAIQDLDFENQGIPKVKTPEARNYWRDLKKRMNEVDSISKRFFYVADVSKEYKLYKKFYYYYNARGINFFNYFGPGMVVQINYLIDHLNIPILKYTELPHILMVVYPEKLQEQNIVVSSTENIIEKPESLRERKVVTHTQKIKVDSLEVNFLFYDYLIADGDIVSLNYNGDWILEAEELEKSPKSFRLKFNESGYNYIIMHADSEGRRPPNTMGISYHYKGRKKEIIIKSDMSTSTLVEIELDMGK